MYKTMEKMELRCESRRHKRTLVWMAVVCVLASIALTFVDVGLGFAVLLGSGIGTICAYFSMVNHEEEMLIIDERGIRTNEWEVEWGEVVGCHIGYYTNRSAHLVVVRKDGKWLFCAIEWFKFDRFEVGHFIDKMAGRKIFDIGKAAETKGSNIAILSAGLVCVAGGVLLGRMLNDLVIGIVVGAVLSVPVYYCVKRAWEDREWDKWSEKG
ncbi:MAG: hypothetical protein II951_00175 [Bacteroidales bacterium]|nr:hypothetical protein [Bacteroidales bacterium]